MAISTQMGVRYEYRDFGLQRITANLQRLGASALRVGVVGPKASESNGRLTNAENAVIQMFGLAPRHYVRRDFLREPFIGRQPLVASILRRVVSRTVTLSESPEAALDWAGRQLADVARNAIMDHEVPPANAPATIWKKGFNHPLVDTLSLFDSISHRIVRPSGDVLEAGATGDYDAFEIGGDINPNGGA